MDFVTWGRNPWEQQMLTHVAWSLLYLSAAAGVLFMVAHTLYVWWQKPASAGVTPASASTPLAARLPERIERHSLGARLFHGIMAAAMLALLATAFLPIVGLPFAWVTLHWIAGLVLTASIVYHIIHASIWLDFWSIWPNRDDVTESMVRLRRAFGGAEPAPRKAGKYPTDNKLYHAVLVLAGFAAIATGLLMMVRVQTPFLTRNPYLFADRTWGVMYVLHGFAGVGLVALTVVHIYFALRPEKLWITKSMIEGSISRRQYLDHHDPTRWVVAPSTPPPPDERQQKVAM